MTGSVASQRRTCSQLGFSLLEILVGCALVGLVIGAAVPKLPPMLGSFQVQSTAFQVANDLRLARQRAVAINGKGRIVFASGNYQMRRESPVGSGTYVNDGAPVTLPPHTTIASSPANPTFDSRGLMTAPYTITVSNSYASKTITVSAIGRVAID